MLARLQQPGLTRKHPRVDPSNPFDPSTGRLKQNAYATGDLTYFRWREDGAMTLESDGRPALPTGASEFDRGLKLVVPEAAYRPDGWFDGGFIVIDGSYTKDGAGLPLWKPRAAGLTGSEAAASELNGGFRRSIASHVGDTLTLDMPLPVTDYTGRNRVTAYVGYDGSQEQATAKLGNLKNFWGFPLIPTKNPFTTASGLKQN
jgi:hypothetical protein